MTPRGNARDIGLVKGPVGVAGTPGAATKSASHVPLRGRPCLLVFLKLRAMPLQPRCGHRARHNLPSSSLPRAPPPHPAQAPSRRVRIVVQLAPQRSWILYAPLQPTPQHLLRLLEVAPRPTGGLFSSLPFAQRDFAPLRTEEA